MIQLRFEEAKSFNLLGFFDWEMEVLDPIGLTSEEEQKFSFKEPDFDIWDQDPKQLILDDSSISENTENGSVPESPESNSMEEYFTVLGFSDNFEVIMDREEGAVLVLEKPPSVADNSDVEDFTDFDDNCIPLDDTIDEFLEHMKTQEIAGNLKYGSEYAGPKTLEIRAYLELEENEKMEEVDPSVFEAMENASNPCKLPQSINQKALPENQPSLCNELTEIDQKFLGQHTSEFLESDEFYAQPMLNEKHKNNPGTRKLLKNQKPASGTRELASAETGKKKFWLCERCGRKIGSKGYINKHLETHNPTNDFACRNCGKVFKTSARRYQHEQQHSALKVQCQICDKEFNNRFSFKAHHRYKHSDRKKPECQICNKILSCKRSLREHEKRIHKLN
jgi:hypothetical protein